jgi:hypothetical protein
MLTLLQANHLYDDSAIREVIYTPAAGEEVSSLVINFCSSSLRLADAAADAAWAELQATRPSNGILGAEHVVTAAEAAANTLAIDTGVPDLTVAVVEIFRANVNVTGDAVISHANGAITVANGATYSLTAADVIRWMARP